MATDITKIYSIIIGTAAIGAIGILISIAISNTLDNNYCEAVYPSPVINNENIYSIQDTSWASTQIMEAGYIKCCRFYYNVDHERKIQCKVFKEK